MLSPKQTTFAGDLLAGAGGDIAGNRLFSPSSRSTLPRVVMTQSWAVLPSTRGMAVSLRSSMPRAPVESSRVMVGSRKRWTSAQNESPKTIGRAWEGSPAGSGLITIRWPVPLISASRAGGKLPEVPSSVRSMRQSRPFLSCSDSSGAYNASPAQRSMTPPEGIE